MSKSNEQAAKFREAGIKLLSQEKFFGALVALNKSLSVAEPGSLEIALAFEARSEVFFQVEQYEKCLKNVAAAREHGYPEDKLEHLKEREEKCRKLADEKCQNTADELRNFLKISLPINEKLPFVADCLELRESEKFGRHIVTNCDLKPGDVIAVEESHFHFISSSAICMRCFNCFRSNMLDLIPSSTSG
jgi:SET and MYND domain-containing protein 4